jgi:hypothetical protein
MEGLKKRHNLQKKKYEEKTAVQNKGFSTSSQLTQIRKNAIK